MRRRRKMQGVDTCMQGVDDCMQADRMQPACSLHASLMWPRLYTRPVTLQLLYKVKR